MERNVLEKIVERGKMPVLFIGSGISKRYLYRYPNWEQLLKNSFKYIDQTSFSYEKHLDELKRQGITQFEVYTQLGSYAEAEFNAAFFEKRIKIKGTGGNKRPAWIERGISPYKMYLSRMFKDMKLYRNGTLLEELDKFRSLKNKVTASKSALAFFTMIILTFLSKFIAYYLTKIIFGEVLDIDPK